MLLTSSKHKTGTDRIREVADIIKSDIIVNIQGDEPFINPVNIDNTILPLLSDNKLNVSTLAVRIENKKDIDDPNKVKVVFDNFYNAMYFSRSRIPFELDRKKSIYYKHIGLYVFRKNYLYAFSEMKQTKLEKTEKLEQLRILENGERIRVVLTKKDSLSIDTMKDFKDLLKLMKI